MKLKVKFSSIFSFIHLVHAYILDTAESSNPDYATDTTLGCHSSPDLDQR